jgi:hypothetical protein
MMVNPSPTLKESTGTTVLSLPFNVANFRFVIPPPLDGALKINKRPWISHGLETKKAMGLAPMASAARFRA